MDYTPTVRYLPQPYGLFNLGFLLPVSSALSTLLYNPVTFSALLTLLLYSTLSLLPCDLFCPARYCFVNHSSFPPFALQLVRRLLSPLAHVTIGGLLSARKKLLSYDLTPST